MQNISETHLQSRMPATFENTIFPHFLKDSKDNT